MGTYAITGAAGGIGAATRALLEADGHEVIGIDLAGTDIDADLSSPAGRAAAAAAVGERTGRLDGVVPCAGLNGIPSVDAGLLTAVNYFGTVQLLAELRPLLAAADSSAVVLISSFATTTQPLTAMELVDACLSGDEDTARALGGQLGPFVAYPSTKTAICRWMRTVGMGEDWIGAGIRMNAVAPGVTETQMVAEVRADETIGQFLDQIPIPLGRTAQAEEVARAIVWLLGANSSYVVGSVLFVDGGTDALVRPDGYPTPMS